MKISAVLITFNEEKNIRRAIESLSWADEILVVDSLSTDRTVEIARSLGAKVLKQRWLGFAQQKQLAVESAENDWIFSLDADEEVSTALSEEISQIKKLQAPADGYKIPRLTFYMNRMIRHGDWYPDWQLRFFNRQKGRWRDVLIHESIEMTRNARIEKLRGDIFHYSVESPSEHQRMIVERYAPMAARQMFERGRRTSKLRVIFSPALTFFRSYFFKLGFMDGFPGFCIACFAAQNTFLKHLLLLEMQRKPVQSAQNSKEV